MKKNIFIVSAAMLALISCTKDEVIQTNNGQKIGFHTSMETRADVLIQDNLSKFYVTALNKKGQTYFSDVVFEKDTDNPTYFKSEQDYYWPDGGLKFYAYYPAITHTEEIEENGETKKTEVSDIGIINYKPNENLDEFKTLKLTGYTPNQDIKEQLDFITAQADGNKNNASVGLNFNHQLSQIQVNAYNQNSGYNIYIKAIKIKNVIRTGDFIFYSAKWIVPEEKDLSEENLTDYEIQFNEIKLSAQSVSLMGDKGSAMLIPQKRVQWENDDATNGSYIAFCVRAFTKKADGTDGRKIFPTTEDADYGWVAHPEAFDWSNGYKYTYNCDFTNGLGIIAPDPYDPDGEGGEDPISPENPGEEVYGEKISVSVDFSSWRNTNDINDDKIYDSSHTVPMD